MEQYLGVKIVQAAPMTAQQFNEAIRPLHYSGDNQEGYMVVYEDGYESWSPKDAFEKAYRRTNGMTFGQAVEAMKIGSKVTRDGWNGKGMYAVYQKGYPEGIPCNKQTAEAWGLNEGDLFVVRPYLQLKCADGTHAMWTPSTSDVLADDWNIVL